MLVPLQPGKSTSASTAGWTLGFHLRDPGRSQGMNAFMYFGPRIFHRLDLDDAQHVLQELFYFSYERKLCFWAWRASGKQVPDPE